MQHKLRQSTIRSRDLLWITAELPRRHRLQCWRQMFKRPMQRRLSWRRSQILDRRQQASCHRTCGRPGRSLPLDHRLLHNIVLSSPTETSKAAGRSRTSTGWVAGMESGQYERPRQCATACTAASTDAYDEWRRVPAYGAAYVAEYTGGL